MTVKSDGFRLNPSALLEVLNRAKRDGRKVLAAVATAGSTPTGSFDDLIAIADACDEFGAWLHVDAAHGGSALLSKSHRARLAGIERARSVAWDPHKMMLLPLPAGMLLVREEADLQAAFAQRAPYIFHEGAPDARIRDQGVRSFQCSRRADVLKLWVVLQRLGRNGVAVLHDHLCDLAVQVRDELRRHSEFVVLHEPESNILCFRYVGDGRLDDDALDALNREIREQYNRSGKGWITATLLDGRRVLRVTMMNPRSTAAHIRAMVESLLAMGESLHAALRG